MKLLLSLTALAAAADAGLSPLPLLAIGFLGLLASVMPSLGRLRDESRARAMTQPAEDLCPVCHRSWQRLGEHLAFAHGETVVGWVA